MSTWRAVMSIILPPAAVIDRGCGAFMLVCVLTLFGWMPGVIAAFAINLLHPRGGRRYVTVPGYRDDGAALEKRKRRARFIRLADGDELEVVDARSAPDDLQSLYHDD